MALPKDYGGGAPAPKKKKAAKPKPRVVKVAPEATRPVTAPQRKAIAKGIEQQRVVAFANKVSSTQGRKAASEAKPAKLHIVDRKEFERANRGTKTARSLNSAFDTEVKVARKVAAPAVKVLDLTAKPGQAIGKKVEKLTGSKTAGFVGSIALDPLTYLTFGRSAVATTVARRAGETAYKDAIKTGASHEVATKAGDKAASKAAKSAPQNHGLVIKVGRHSTSGRTTAYVSRKTGLSKVATKIRESGPVQGLGQDLRPDFRPKGVTAEEHTAVRGASREARAQTTRGRVEAISKAQALKKSLKAEDHARVVNAIERGTVYNLPEHLRGPAREVESAFRRARKEEVKAGIKVGNRRNYFTHAVEEQADEAGKKGRSGGKRVIRPDYGKARKHEGTVEQIAERGGPEFSTNIPAVVAGRLSKSAGDVAQAKMNRALGDVGRKVKHGERVDLKDGEALYKIHGSDIQHLTRWEEEAVKAGTKKPPKKGEVKYVVLNEKMVEDAVKSVAPGASRSTIGRGYDKVQGGFKFVATVPNPGFHARNLYGDTFNAYLGQGTAKLAKNVGTATRTLHALGKQEEAARKLTVTADRGAGNRAARRAGQVVKDTRTKDHGINVRGKYGGKEFISFDDLAKEAVNAGAIRSGFVSREIPELLRDTSKAASSREYGRHIKRAIQNREDLIRLATYIGARKGGKTAREAADWAAKHHFDYGDLTDFERTVMRRLLPFYTFSARNIPLQAKKVLTNPGKYANIEKIRDELAGAAGLPDDWQSKIPEYQQRGIPFPVKIGKGIVLASPSLPASDLNQLTIPGFNVANPISVGDEQMKKFLSMLNPVIKSPVELFANYNFFFRGPIERDESPLVAAPSYVSKFGPDIRRKLGIVSDYVDKRSGKKGWGWPAKVDYVAKVMPGPTNTLQQLITPLANRRGQDTEAKFVSYLGGVKADPYDPTSTAITQMFNQKAALSKKRFAVGQTAKGKDKPEYKKLSKQINELDYAIYKLSKKRGDKKPLGRPRPQGRRVSLLSQAKGPSIKDMLGSSGPTLNEMLGN